MKVAAYTVVLSAVALGAGVVLTPSSEAGSAVRPRIQVATTPPSYAGTALYVSETPSARALTSLELSVKAAATKPKATVKPPTKKGAPAAKQAAAPVQTAALATPDEAQRQIGLLRKIAANAQAQWVGDWAPTAKVRATVEALTAGPRRSGTVLPLVVYNLPHRDCGSYSKGGATSPAAYRAWIDEVATGLGTTKAIVILEPDALPSMHCLPAAAQAERLELMRYAGVRLEAQPGTDVYLDAGNALWKPVDVMVERLDAAGIGQVRGFSLNVANFDTTDNEVRYGRQLSTGLGGKPFVVDTGRNGRGALTGTLAWCNPPGRALGDRPTTKPGLAGVDALLWVKTIGSSDGNCRPGEPPAGTYDLAYALGLAERAGW